MLLLCSLCETVSQNEQRSTLVVDIKIVSGDITQQRADAMITARNALS